MKNILLLLIATLSLASCQKRGVAPEPFGAVPSERQMMWQEMEYYAFIHFSINTFTATEWETGDKPTTLFNPSELDCEQWAKACKEAGMKGIILTCKHHDGFCLWPSKYSEYTVKNSPWKQGKGDVVGELSEACKKYGLKFGIYLSPWDRNHAEYGRPEYITYMRNQLQELLTNYGEVFEVWFDGANGGTGYYGGANEHREIDRATYYQWDETFSMIRQLQPNAVIFGNGGLDVRWCGNESGTSGESVWSTLFSERYTPGLPNYPELNQGNEDGINWVPSEVDVSIRPSWFYRQSEDDKVHSLDRLMNIYYNSVGNNGSLLLNLPPDRRGLIHENDVETLKRMKQAIDSDLGHNLVYDVDVKSSNERGRDFSAEAVNDNNKETYWATEDGVNTGCITFDLGKTTKINRLLVQEYIRLGQRVRGFKVEAFVEGAWQEVAKATTIGYKRILRFETVETDQIRFTITDAKACPTISNIEMFYATEEWKKPQAQTTTEVSQLVSPENWTAEEKEIDLGKIVDKDPKTVCYQEATPPIDLTIDMGAAHDIKGFRYLPDQSEGRRGVINQYEFSVSRDGKNWESVSQGEFSNIQNNPIWQEKNFEATTARYIRLTMLSNTQKDNVAGYAELEILKK
ncbi:MAG: alpha-L-fucosidase [Rikenellaceae bacterium]